MKAKTIKLSCPATREFWEVPVLFEDEHLMALDKPALLLTSPDRDTPERPSLMGLLHEGVTAGKPWAVERGLTYAMNAHHLDFETSGVLLLARSKTVLVALANLFGAEKALKTFVALVHGEPLEERWEVDAPIAPHPGKPGLMRVDRQRGKRSRTRFERLERFADYSLVQCQPLTSRRHQIRVHLRWRRLPIVGDATYGGRLLRLSSLKDGYRLKDGARERPLVATCALHAERLDFNHPVTGAPLSITAPWPKDLSVAVKYLRRYAAAM